MAASVARFAGALLLLAGLAAHDAAAQASLRFERDERERTLTLLAGPVSLPANVGYADAFVSVAAGGTWPIDGWLRAFEVDVVDGEGEVVAARLLHHAGLVDPAERDLFNPVARRIVAFGMETAGISLPGQLGYRVQPSDSVVVAGAFFNPTAEPFAEVYLRMRMIYADARHDPRHQSVLPFYLDAAPPGVAQFDAPPGVSEHSLEWRPSIAGRVLAVGGHLHAGGVSVRLEDVSSGEVLWTGHAQYDAGGALTGVTRKVFARGFRMEPDRAYRITATYANPTDTPIPGAMGHVAGLFLPDDVDRMPPADRLHPAYVADLYGKILAGGTTHAAHGGHAAHGAHATH
jgi:hypothetical protein